MLLMVLVLVVVAMALVVRQVAVFMGVAGLDLTPAVQHSDRAQRGL